jgi:signal transduction histidine kinase/DNA-binding response OmpR family regulator
MIKIQSDNFRRTRRDRPVALLMIGLWSIALPALHAQNAQFNTIWSQIELKIDQPNVDTGYQFILDDIKVYCSGDVNCLLFTYDSIRTKLERKFKLNAAIKVTAELIRLAEQRGLVEKMAQGHSDISRYYDALKNAKASSIHLDLALKYYEILGDKRKIILCNFKKIFKTSNDDNIDQTKQKVESLINEAIAARDSFLVGYLISTFLPLSLETDPPEKIEAHFATFERIMDPDTKVRLERRRWAVFWEQKGLYMRKKGAFQAAKACCEKALAFLKVAEDSWLELNTILDLVEIDLELGNRKAAKSRLEPAFDMSEKLKSDELFVRLFSVASEIAEEEGRYADALIYLKKMNAAQANINKTGDEKISQNYYLEVENKNKVLELKQSKDRLGYTMVISILALLLAAGFLFGFYKQRKSKRVLADQNALIQAQTEQLKSLDEAKSRFFANVSHELRTPLTLLTGPIKTLLKENQLTEKQIRLLQVADRSGKQLGQLINEILDLRKLEMGKMYINAETTELRAYFQSYFAQFESLAEQKHINYTHVLDIPNGATADLDREKCRQLLYNLLSNAFKFTPTGGKIAARIQVTEHQLQFSVADSGAGIHPDDLPNVFERYFQSNRPDKPAEGGTGIGLALCREYAQIFGGTIRVESNLGEGSTFTVCFPITLYDETSVSSQAEPAKNTYVFPGSEADETIIASLAGSAPENDPADRPGILLVEDNPDLQDYIRVILSEKYKVITASNGQIALELLTNNPDASPITPALILSDLMMPVMDGYQLLERLKSDDATRHIPTIMLTARAEAQDKLNALRIGVDDYLTKPFDEEELLVRIENLLKNQAIRRQEIAAAAEPETPHPIMLQPDRAWLETFEVYVQKHYAGDLLSVSALAYAFAMSESTLLRQLKRLTGLSPLQYIQEVRLNEARRLLESRTYNSIAQVASKVGYDDARSFTRSFKQRFGKLPSEIMEA